MRNPKGWPTHTVSDVCELIVDCVNRTAPIVDHKTPFKMIRTSNVRNGAVNLEDVRYVEEAVFRRWNRRAYPQRGDVILTREAPVGEAGIISSDDSVFLGQRLMLYRVNQNAITPEFMLAAFQSSHLLSQFHRHGSGSTVKHLSLPACREFELRLPPPNLQKQYALGFRRIHTIKQNVAKAECQIDKLFVGLRNVLSEVSCDLSSLRI